MRHARIDAAQAVICTGFQDHDVGFQLQHPVDPRERAAARFAADSGIHYPPVEPGRLKFTLQLSRISVILIYAETRGKAVAHCNDGPHVGGLVLLRRDSGFFLLLRSGNLYPQNNHSDESCKPDPSLHTVRLLL